MMEELFNAYLPAVRDLKEFGLMVNGVTYKSDSTMKYDCRQNEIIVLKIQVFKMNCKELEKEMEKRDAMTPKVPPSQRVELTP